MKRNPLELEHSHARTAIAERLGTINRPNYVRDFVYGGIDGAITTFAIVAGVVGASLSSSVILILGLANLLADGFSMAASNYSGTKTVTDEHRKARKIETRHIELVPQGEREEVRQLLARKGLKGEALEHAVDAITEDRGRWIDFMLQEEYGFALTQPSPIIAGAVTFAAFIVCGTVPLLPFLLGHESSFAISLAMTAVVFFLIGAAKSIWSLAAWWRSGLETLIIGGVAASLAFAVGYLLRGVVPA